MWMSPCLLLLFQTLTPSLTISLYRGPKHQQVKEDQVFLDVSVAHGFLGRKLLYNHWDFELVRPDNLERECIEEVCSYEEAREVFEDDFKTAEKNFGRLTHIMGKEEQDGQLCSLVGNMADPLDCSHGSQPVADGNPFKLDTGTTGIDVAGLVAGLIAAVVSVVMFVVVAMYCIKYRAKERRRSRMQDNLYPGMALTSFDEEPKPEAAPGLPSYEQAMASTGVHDAPPPPYNRDSTNRTLPT